MKISDKPHTIGSCAGGPHAARPCHAKTFSEVLKGQKKSTGEASREGHEKCEAPELEARGKREFPAAPVAAALTPLSVPLATLRDSTPIAGGQAIAPPEAILSSLVEEITAAVPSGGNASVEIQFDSRTLQGLHVRIQKTGEGVEVRFTTSSEPVSRLLANNANTLAAALVQRGYTSPLISVQAPSTAAPSAGSTGEGRPSGRDGGSRGRQDQHGGRKQR